MAALLSWAKIAAIAWGAALLVVLLAEVRVVGRWVPDWLRSLSRMVVLVGTIAAVTLGVLVGSRLFADSLAARPQTNPPGSQSFSISFESPNAFFHSLYLSTHQEELSRPVSDDSTPVTFVVSPGETAASVAERLQVAGLVSNGEVFRRYMAFYGLDASLQAGTYTLRPNMTIPEMAAALQSAGGEGVTVTIPEGWRAEEIAWLLDQQGLVRSDDFLAWLSSPEYDYAWLASRPAGATLEGFLFPDTYQFPEETTPGEIIGRMLSDFDARVGSAVEVGLAGKRIFDLAVGDYRPLTVYDVITLASIVEREAQVAEERPIIASVYFNRLDPKYRDQVAYYLSSDPTIQYAKGFDSATGSWWNPMVPGEGQTMEHPYNTFRRQGLPPGPICNPGLAAIQAVMNPAPTTYLYFHAIGKGRHVFASTLEEHMQNQERYQP